MCVGLQIGSVLWKLHAEGGGSQEHASFDSADGKGEEVLSDKPFLLDIAIASPHRIPGHASIHIHGRRLVPLLPFMGTDLYHCFHSWLPIRAIAWSHVDS